MRIVSRVYRFTSQRCLTPSDCGLFTFFYFCLMTSKFLYIQHGAICSEHLEREYHLPGVLSWWREFSSQPLTEFWLHTLSSCQVCNWGIQYHLCRTHRGLWGLVVVRLSWLSGRALAAQARGVLGLTPGNCWLFHFCLKTSNFLCSHIRLQFEHHEVITLHAHAWSMPKQLIWSISVFISFSESLKTAQVICTKHWSQKRQ